jgi:aconitate hydratase
VFINESDYEKIDQGDHLSIEFETILDNESATVTNTSKQLDILVKSPLTSEELEIVKKGGRLNWIKLRA